MICCKTRWSTREKERTEKEKRENVLIRRKVKKFLIKSGKRLLVLAKASTLRALKLVLL